MPADLDLVAGDDLLQQPFDLAVVDLDHPLAFGADDVGVVAVFGHDDVVGGAGAQIGGADDGQFGEQIQSAEDTRPPDGVISAEEARSSTSADVRWAWSLQTISSTVRRALVSLYPEFFRRCMAVSSNGFVRHTLLPLLILSLNIVHTWR